jgi:hypothetical protein
VEFSPVVLRKNLVAPVLAVIGISLVTWASRDFLPIVIIGCAALAVGFVTIIATLRKERAHRDQQ